MSIIPLYTFICTSFILLFLCFHEGTSQRLLRTLYASALFFIPFVLCLIMSMVCAFSSVYKRRSLETQTPHRFEYHWFNAIRKHLRFSPVVSIKAKTQTGYEPRPPLSSTTTKGPSPP